MNIYSLRRVGAVIIAVLIVLIVLSLIPFNVIPIETTETYFVTENKLEPYTEKEPYTVKEPVIKQEVLYEDRPFSVPFGISVPLTIDSPDIEISGRFELPGTGALRVMLSNKIIYEQLGTSGDFQMTFPVGKYTIVVRDSMVWGERLYLKVIKKWTEEATITKYREVSKNREVPVQIEKQRTETSYIKVSWWEMLFGISRSKYEAATAK